MIFQRQSGRADVRDVAYEYNPYRAEAAFRRMQNNGITGGQVVYALK